MKPNRWLRVVSGAVLAVAGALAALHAQAGTTSKDAEWPMYNRDLAGTRYSPLKQITTGNVATLARAWSYPLGRDKTAGSLSGGSEFTPIVVNGVMYVAASDRVAALEPETGRELWRYQVTNGVPSRRGVAYWPGDAKPSAAHLLHRRAPSDRADGARGRTGRRLRQGRRSRHGRAVQLGADRLQEPADRRHERIARRRARVRRADRRERCGSSTRWRSLAIPPTRRGTPRAGRTAPAPTAGRSRRRSMPSEACSTSRSKRRGPTITGAAIGSATICTATRSSRSRPTPAS